MKGLIRTLAAATLLAQGALAQGQVTPAKVMIAKDTMGGVERMIIVRALTPRIDSLIKKLDNLPFGSAEFEATNKALQAAMEELPRSPVAQGGGRSTFRIEYTAPSVALRGSIMDAVPQGTMGFTAGGVNRPSYTPFGTFVEYFQYPAVMAIEASSPASRVGLRIGDTVTAYDGLDLRRSPINMTQLLRPGREVTVKLRREGETKDVVVMVEKASDRLMVERRMQVAQEMVAPAAAPAVGPQRRLVEEQVAAGMVARGVPAAAAPARSPVAVGGTYARASTLGPAVTGVFGAAMTDVDPDLAKALNGMDGKRGVLVTVVPPGSLADRVLGLRGGDVILSVEAYEVPSLTQLRLRLGQAEQSGAEKVKLTILRGGKTQEITFPQR